MKSGETWTSVDCDKSLRVTVNPRATTDKFYKKNTYSKNKNSEVFKSTTERQKNKK